MKFILKLCVAAVCAGAIMICAGLFADRICLDENLIRLHVVANSDTEEDQQLKLEVRDEIVQYLKEEMKELTDVSQAKEFIKENLNKLKSIAEAVIQKAGLQDKVSVSLQKECFDTRHYDSFSLPSGVYESLRIRIGDAQGQNWWCVVFPSLCFQAAATEVEEEAVGAGFSHELTDTLTNRDGYQVRFFVLDVLGRIENFFFRKSN